MKETLEQKNQRFLDYYLNMEPAKIWQLPPAKRSEPEKHVFNDDYFAMWKYDGEWHRVIKDLLGNVHIQTRSVSKVTGTYGNKTEHFPHIVEDMKKYPNATVFLGEICFVDPKKTSKDLAKITRCKAPKAIERQKAFNVPLQYVIFDVLSYDKQCFVNRPFIDRYLPKYILNHGADNFTAPLNADGSDAKKMLEHIWNKGGEGIVLIKKDATYLPGKRKAWESCKVKRSLDELDVRVVDVIEPKRLYEGTELETWKYWEGDTPVTKPYYHGWKNGVVIIHNENRVRVTSGLTDDDRAWLATDDAAALFSAEMISATITGMEITKDSIRHPHLIRLRTDK